MSRREAAGLAGTPLRRVGRGLWLLFLLGALAPEPVAARQHDALWEAIRDGRAVGLMRHALAPGTGDPADFQLDDCATQRNLSDEGRAQARAIGERFRANGIGAADVYSSEWCRCLETAELLGLGPVEPLPALNSFFRDRSKGAGRTAALRRFLAERSGAPPIVLVTHQVNITAISGVLPRSGEIVVLRVGGEDIQVLGRIEPAP